MASLAVTITATGGTDVVVAFALRVVTGAKKAAAQNGATGSGAPVPPQQSITPNASGSWVYGVALAYPENGDFTANAATTFTTNAYGGGYCTYGTFRSTSTTTAGTPVTLGATAPTGEYNNILMAEILASGTLAEDASTPPTLNSTFQSSLTTATFTPPPGSLLVAQAGSLSTSVAISDSLGLTWHNLAAVSTTYNIWVADMPANPQPLMAGYL
jgi:hypothetical protein